ncbi:hypothetical protein PROFUN_02666 [Planoprotostelium fungivorum]|uniref:Uncharacterized protein n=1 Tax=Planoprotostelium fungivorum TaxID=1890364 RepID=A0A2P6NVD1_9EUKA|nr:hypothetical protein PROFUN_02666 [Planoprotostelium fungivorum]
MKSYNVLWMIHVFISEEGKERDYATAPRPHQDPHSPIGSRDGGMEETAAALMGFILSLLALLWMWTLGIYLISTLGYTLHSMFNYHVFPLFRDHTSPSYKVEEHISTSV